MQSSIENPIIRKHFKKTSWILLILNLVAYPLFALLMSKAKEQAVPLLIMTGIAVILSICVTAIHPLIQIYWWEYNNKKSKNK